MRLVILYRELRKNLRILALKNAFDQLHLFQVNGRTLYTYV